MRRLLFPLVPLYAAVVGLRGWLFELGILKQRRLGHPVISVGSLSAGGAGKTPMVMLLAKLLQRREFEVRILTRGYRRKSIAILRVDPEGDAREFGDEPLLMARRCKTVAVWVGIDRHRAGRMSERSEVPGRKVVYLLDDGFQHRKLARDVDIVLVTRQDVDDRLLPAGNLREPLKAVGRADVVVVRGDEAEVAGFAGGTPVWSIRRRLVFPEGIASPVRPLVFCGLARPEGFLAMLRAEGIVPAGVSIFSDHYAYGDEDVVRLVGMARSSKADGFLTTEKDAVKLNSWMMERLQAVGPVVAPELRVELAEEDAMMEELVGMLAATSRGS